MLPGAAPVFFWFVRLSRGRAVTMAGQPCPLTYADIRDASQRCVCELPPDTIENLLTDLDDLFLELSADHGGHSSQRSD